MLQIVYNSIVFNSIVHLTPDMVSQGLLTLDAYMTVDEAE